MKLSVSQSDISLSDLSTTPTVSEASLNGSSPEGVALVWQNLTVKTHKKVCESIVILRFIASCYWTMFLAKLMEVFGPLWVLLALERAHC
jgi:hypothetical protein